jgi:hypothetical protein
MSDPFPPIRRLSPRRWVVDLAVAVAVAAGATFLIAFGAYSVMSGAGGRRGPAAEASEEQVRRGCAACHLYPPPDSFPVGAWPAEVERGYRFAREAGTADALPPMDSVVRFYQRRAPERLPIILPDDAPGPPPVAFHSAGYYVPAEQTEPAVSNVNLVHLFDDRRLDILVCDMRDGWVSVLRPFESDPSPRVLGKVAHPAHAEVVDLDGDGIKDVVVADLGSFFPTNDRVGKVVLLKGRAYGTFTPITLLEGVGRVADVQAADFNGDGKTDLVVAAFGWQTTGEVIYLENQTTDWSHPVFVPHVLDDRHGAIHVPVADLNGDGRPDFVALISQEHETIVAFLNDGDGRFHKETIYTGPHPAYGSSGIQLVDMNGDGKLDVLYTNGDGMDSSLLKPYHSVQWLENRGSYPFVHHPLTQMYGVYRAVAADLDGDGLPDVVAVSCIPEAMYGDVPRQYGLDSVVLLKQTSRGRFTRYALEKGACDHVTCAVGDLNGVGKNDLVIGNFYVTREQAHNKHAITVWRHE